MTRVLVIERDDSSRRELREEFERNGFAVVEAANLTDVARVGVGQVATVVANATMVASADDFLAFAASVPVVLVADSPSIPEAVECMRQGAADYVAKPFQPATLIAAVERAASRAQPMVAGMTAFSSIVGECPAMRDLFDQVAKWAPTEATVLIQGEVGTGKELIARALHASSGRRHAQIIALNCAAIPESMIESELFGLGAGVSSAPLAAPRPGLLEAADGGTLFLGEIGDMPPTAQARLLRFLQDGRIRRLGSAKTRRVNVRVIAATHRNIVELARNNQFRDDLLRRIDAALRVPPLRDRGEDVIKLAHVLLGRACGKLNKHRRSFSSSALDAMRSYPWPGNVRELENAVERAAILSEDETIDAGLLAINTGGAPQPPPEVQGESASSLEGYFLRFVLDNEDQFTETELASKLGISRKSLWERRQRLNIPRRRTRKRGPRRDQR